MDLINLIKEFNPIEVEKLDIQYIVLLNAWKKNIFSEREFLWKIIECSIVSYQLSGKGEQWWEEFSKALYTNFNWDTFLSQCKNNKRFVETKISRIKKLQVLKKNYEEKFEYFIENLERLRDGISWAMNQEKNAKTVVFAIKMFGYGLRIVGLWNDTNRYPKGISIPIDSRLEKIYQHFNKDASITIEKWYEILSEETGIEPLHLDGILWTKINNML